MKRIVVLISGSGSNLQALIDQFHQGHQARIVAVIANKANVYGLTRAEQADIPAQVVANTAYASREDYDAALVRAIDVHQPDLVVLAGFMRILTPGFVSHYAGRMLNIHPSLLPKYTGLHTHQRAIDAGDKEHGTSVHFVTEELDGGPVILQARVPIFADDEIDSVAARVQQQEHRIYPLVVKWFIDGRLKMEAGKAWLDNQPLGPSGHAADD
ncbi:phosphoribosylglycinamide formyltransferase [Salinivibrio sp. MA351]|jgi:phosphoribosylglycinamide formyltransferase-1|uniref:Phosphoribosylglycinamide formyltransferase n=1 Tax=Salinivibrio costicola subsp. alcaliphilus TaxID=272773 RepID=A0ABX3KTW3_SALCS|nr:MULTISPECIES: phosphoribosylglycinamide formyltransferase [Salinivibrio]NUY56572.1 phosphoribosylglycinamide formyltransferase [Salinivibrio sp. EAGSL]OOE89072.1 phosphoribosylglycinamide formyltransferase [Salinivibrio sp. AR640]OOE96606.1 phosphoribosylglycinamide formyltransferase [Salinivibrio sp. MA351]OOF04395.1 phosphoribosylglycinamide formyltransferase [Salinivibrio sp. MA607]OOF05893.1 phosphoribosylglycinamide formyltransferase [Salinivibrio sp. MA440]